jgi:hypothetical protein
MACELRGMSNDADKLPVPYRPDTTRQPDSFHQDHEWTSGKRGGGKVPKDFEWGTNPKQWQEENGVNREK